MGIGGCLYCDQNTAGEHVYGCPLYKSPSRLYDTGIGQDGLDPSCHEVYPKGWVCPKCGAVWAPGVRECEHCKPLVFV